MKEEEVHHVGQWCILVTTFYVYEWNNAILILTWFLYTRENLLKFISYKGVLGNPAL